ncbi:hypothetical protein CVS40_0911 [Lucilia cuprina]|nr:hypothetical protein CVS40_0911 [Lucilia cuprina]
MTTIRVEKENHFPEHYVSNCPSFAAIPVAQRFDFIKNVPACISCFRKGHTVTKCTATKCRVCNSSHHTLLHQYNTTITQTVNPTTSSPGEPSSASVNISTSNKDNVILATALVKIKDRSGQYALLDSGSQINFVSEELSQRLQLEKEENNLSLVGIGKTNSAAKFKIQATVKSRVNSHKFFFDFWVLRSISGYQPDTVISTTGWNIPNNIELSDPYFFKPQKIDMLIGVEIFFELLCVGQIRRSPDIPTVQKTLLGWVVSGKYKNCKTSTNKSCHISTWGNDENDLSLDKIVQRFWELEEIPRDTKVLTLKHQQCEEKFVESIRQLPSGRFEVSLFQRRIRFNKQLYFYNDPVRLHKYMPSQLAGHWKNDTAKELGGNTKSKSLENIESHGFKSQTKWVSNYETNPDSSMIQKNIQEIESFTKALGTYWLPKSDIFKYQLDDSFHSLKATKRNILSVSARLFDPLGLLCPLVVLLQELWLQKLDWDESIPMNLYTSWENFKTNFEIHGFADASMRAYGCCIYVRSRVANQITCRLLTAKSKVAPLKTAMY